MQNFNQAHAIEALKAIFRPGDVFEIRALDATTRGYNRPHTVSGYFDYGHIAMAVGTIVKEITSAHGIYYTPNPVEPALLARAANRLRDMGQKDPSTADKDIPRRRWLLIDCDAVRPSGISSSDEEHQAAREKAIEIRDGLASMGFPQPIEIDSGNGAQLMYSIDLPGGLDNEICEKILAQLQSCNTPQVNVDKSVFNASRIWRMPGSMNCKGDNIPGRLHRQAQIIAMPQELTTVPIELLKDLAGITEQQQPSKPIDLTEYQNRPKGTGAKLDGVNYAAIQDDAEEQFNLDEWIARHCPDIQGPEEWHGGRKWIFPICPFNPDHTNRSAVITEQANGAIGFTCHHNSCQGNDWKKLRELLDSDYVERQRERESAAIEAVRPIQPVSHQPSAEQVAENKARPVIEAIDDSDIGEPEQEQEEEIQEEPAPWRSVTNDDICGVIDGTLLGEMAGLYASITKPNLPLEAALLKAIVTAGCALSGPGAPDTDQISLLPPIGALRARLRINTAGGQVCNVYALLAANSASGKDIGNLLDTITEAKQWSLGTSGSAEGIAEALIKKPNGLISISEFMNWLDEKHWQYKATSFLTEAFSKGFFRHNFSSRGGKNGTSECDYCYPNIIANIQPEVFERIVKMQDISSGFMGRFIFARMPVFFGDPARVDINRILTRFGELLPVFERKKGVVDVPEDYGAELSAMFRQYSPEKLHPSWRRLVNEYLPRFAVMLSMDYQAHTQGEAVILREQNWTGAKKMVQWFFGQAETLLAQVEDETLTAKIQEKLIRRFVQIIAKYDRGKGVSLRQLSQHASHTGTTAEQRYNLMLEVIERGIIQAVDSKGTAIPIQGMKYDAFNKDGRGIKFKVKRIPPGLL